jgi:hypothetical protein
MEKNRSQFRNSKIITDYIDVLYNTTHKKYANTLQIPDDAIPRRIPEFPQAIFGVYQYYFTYTRKSRTFVMLPHWNVNEVGSMSRRRGWVNILYALTRSCNSMVSRSTVTCNVTLADNNFNHIPGPVRNQVCRSELKPSFRARQRVLNFQKVIACPEANLKWLRRCQIRKLVPAIIGPVLANLPLY